MARYNFNLNDIEASSSGGRIPPGTYTAQVVEIEETDSQAGNPMLVWHWEITDGEAAGRTIRSHTVLLDHALFSLKEHLEAFGYSGEIDFDIPDLEKGLSGKRAVLAIGERKGRTRKGEEGMFPQVENVSPFGKQTDKKKKKAKTEQTDDSDIPF